MKPDGSREKKAIRYSMPVSAIETFVRTRKSLYVEALAANLAHDIKSPLTCIKTFTDFVDRRYDDAVFRRKFKKSVKDAILRINDRVERLMDVARSSKKCRKKTSLNLVIKHSINDLRGYLELNNIYIDLNLAHLKKILLKSPLIKRAIENLIMNAAEAAGEGGTIQVKTRLLADGSQELSVKDNGKGISEKEIQRIFQPFYSGKKNGTGLGLWIVLCALDEHGARIAVKSTAGCGSEFTIRFPPA